MNAPFKELRLSEQELGIALCAAGVMPQTHSPLRRVRPNGNASPAALRQHGMLDAQGGISQDWRLALAALSAPSAYVWVYWRASANQGTARMFVPAGLGFVAHGRSDAAHLLAMPFLPDTLVASLLSTLTPDNVGEVRSFSEALWPDEVAALAAVSDVYREESLRAMLERRPPQFATVSFDQLEYETRWALSNDDPRWLGGVLRAHAPDAFLPRAEYLRSGVQGLVSRGWLAFSNDRFSLSADLQGLCFVLSNTTPYLALQSRSADGNSRHALFVRSLVAIVTLEFLLTDAGQPFLRLSSVNAASARQLLNVCVSEVAASLPPPPPVAAPQRPQPATTVARAAAQTPSAQAVSARPVAQAPRPQPGSARPAAAPISPVVQQPQASPVNRARTCVKCGKPVPAGRKFCTGCGTPVASA